MQTKKWKKQQRKWWKCGPDLSAVRHKSIDNLPAATKQSHDVSWSLCWLRRRAILTIVNELLPLNLHIINKWSINKTTIRTTLNNSRSQIITNSGVARNFSQGVRNSSCLECSTYALHCFCREQNSDRRMRHHLPHFLNGNLTDVAEMHHSEHSTATAAHCWWQHALLQLSRRRTRQVCRRWCQLRLTQAFVTWQDWWK